MGVVDEFEVATVLTLDARVATMATNTVCDCAAYGTIAFWCNARAFAAARARQAAAVIGDTVSSPSTPENKDTKTGSRACR